MFAYIQSRFDWILINPNLLSMVSVAAGYICQVKVHMLLKSKINFDATASNNKNVIGYHGELNISSTTCHKYNGILWNMMEYNRIELNGIRTEKSIT